MGVTDARPRSPTALSIDVEDWFQTENMKSVIPRESWDSCELRVERTTMRMLEILDKQNARATFFVLGWVAEKCPDLVRTIAAEGHEVASHGYNHELIYNLEPGRFRADVARSKAILEDLSGTQVRGYRAPSFSITEWAIRILVEEGFYYDSSMYPTIAHDRYGRLNGIGVRDAIVRMSDGLYEVCVSCLPFRQRGFPWGGGGYFRFVPYTLWLRGIRGILHSGSPYVFYIHPWEIDPGQPRMRGLSRMKAFRQRVNLRHCEQRFVNLAGAFKWITISDLLDTWNTRQRPWWSAADAMQPELSSQMHPPATISRGNRRALP